MLFGLVGLTLMKLSAWLPVVALTLITGSRQASGVKSSNRWVRRIFWLYAFACTVGHIDAPDHMSLQDGGGGREKREKGGKNSQVEACVHVYVINEV